MSLKIFRYEIPITGKPISIAMHGPILTGQLEYWPGMDAVEPHVIFWGLHDDDAQEVTRTFLVTGTGWVVPEGARYVGTAPRGADELVWHLLEVVDHSDLDSAHLAEVGGQGMPEIALPTETISEIETTEIKIHHDPQERIEDAVAVNGTWANNADYDELMNLSERLRVLALDHKTRHDQERKGRF